MSLASYVKVPLEDLVDNFEGHMKNSVIRHHAHPQWICSYMNNGARFCERIAHTETLQDDMNAIFDDLSLPNWDIPIENTTQHKPYRDIFDAKTRKFVEDPYRKDIDLFGYSF